MAVVTTIQDGNGKYVYPNTISDAVYHNKQPMSDILGTEDISGIGDGTLTGAMKEINDKFKNNDVSQKMDTTEYEKDMGSTDISSVGDGTVTGAIDELNTQVNGKVDKTTYDITIGKTNISAYGDGTLTGAVKAIGTKVDNKLDKSVYDKAMGNSNIASIGDGTVTGAINKLNSTSAKSSDITTINTNMAKKLDKSVYDSDMGTTSISGIGDGTVKGAIKYLKDNGGGSSSSGSYVTTSTYNSDMGTTSISGIGNGTVKGAIKALDTSVDSLVDKIGTTNISSIGSTITGAIKSLFQSVSDGKKVVANAITAKGVTTSSSATFATMATNIKNIKTQSVTKITGSCLIGAAAYASAPATNNTLGQSYIVGFPKGTVITVTGITWLGGQSTNNLVCITGATKVGNVSGYSSKKAYYPSTSISPITLTGDGHGVLIELNAIYGGQSSTPYVIVDYTITLPS